MDKRLSRFWPQKEGKGRMASFGIGIAQNPQGRLLRVGAEVFTVKVVRDDG